MRLHLYFTARQAVPFDHLPPPKGAFHRWAGYNDALHDGLSLYSLSWLRGGRQGLTYRDGARGGLIGGFCILWDDSDDVMLQQVWQHRYS